MKPKETSEAAKETAAIDNSAQHHWKDTIDPKQPTTIINGNKVLFIGRGAREITLITDEEDAK